jgi:predicted RNA-binding protein with PIN domain
MSDSPGAVAELPNAELWLVDGYNALHAVLLGGGQSEARRQDWWRSEHRERLVERVARFRDAAACIRVVFDGSTPAPDAGPDPRVDVVFAPSADAWLVRTVRGHETPDRIAVVTGDRQVADRCRHAGAMVVGPRSFLAHCPTANPETCD